MFKGYTKSLKLNDWIRKNCKPSSEGLLVTDVDFIFFDYKKNKYMMLEAKTYDAKMKLWQKQVYKKIDKSLRNDPDYVGFYLITLSHEDPRSSEWIKINTKLVNIYQLKKFLNFELSYADIERK